MNSLVSLYVCIYVFIRKYPCFPVTSPPVFLCLVLCTVIFHRFSLDSFQQNTPDSKVHRDNMGPSWVLSDPDGPHVGTMNLAIRIINHVYILRVM